MDEHQHIRGSEACFPGKNCKFSSTEMENNLHQRPFSNVFFLFCMFAAIRMRERKEYKRTKQELQSTLEEFYQRFYLTYKQMRLKHRKQLQCLKKPGKSLNNPPNRDLI